jgi:hypothetical protein
MSLGIGEAGLWQRRSGGRIRFSQAARHFGAGGGELDNIAAAKIESPV